MAIEYAGTTFFKHPAEPAGHSARDMEMDERVTQLESASSEGTVNTHADLPDPTTVASGSAYYVVNDPNSNLNGQHIAAGSDVGSNASYWEAS